MSLKIAGRNLGLMAVLAMSVLSAPCLAVAPIVAQLANNTPMQIGTITPAVQLSSDVSVFTVYETPNTVSAQPYVISVEVSPDNIHWVFSGTSFISNVAGNTTLATVDMKTVYVRLRMAQYGSNTTPFAYISASLVY